MAVRFLHMVGQEGLRMTCTTPDKIYRCYAYGRLSKEDGDKQESDSIKNQRDLIHTYLDHHTDLQLCMEGYDDGYTGTNFDRPHFQEMLSAIRDDRIDCVVVKDLSRFGREYIGVGRYLEKLFPRLGVRFIAIGEGYDSARLDPAASLMLPFQNLINDSYCRDISVKIRSHLDIKRKNGEFIGAFAAYGYRKNPENKNHLVVDPAAATVVQDIFSWRLAGMSNQKIAERLNYLGILSPLEYKRAGGEKYQSGYQVYAKASWSAVTVRRILANSVYLGVLEQGKRTTPNYKVTSVVTRPRSEWARVENTHEAIVSPQDFALAERLMQLDTRIPPGEKTVHPLAGMVCCGDCFHAMVRKTVREGGKQWQYYICSQHKKDMNQCSLHLVGVHQLEEAVLAGLNLHIQSWVDCTRVFTAVQRRAVQQSELAKCKDRLAALEQERFQAQGLLNALFRKYAIGEVSEEDFREFRRIFQEDCQRLEKCLDIHRQERDRLRKTAASLNAGVAQFQRCGQLTALTRAAAVRLIDQIRVYEKKRVEIVFRYPEAYAQTLQSNLAGEAG